MARRDRPAEESALIVHVLRTPVQKERQVSSCTALAACWWNPWTSAIDGESKARWEIGNPTHDPAELLPWRNVGCGHMAGMGKERSWELSLTW